MATPFAIGQAEEFKSVSSDERNVTPALDHFLTDGFLGSTSGTSVEKKFSLPKNPLKKIMLLKQSINVNIRIISLVCPSFDGIHGVKGVRVKAACLQPRCLHFIAKV